MRAKAAPRRRSERRPAGASRGPQAYSHSLPASLSRAPPSCPRPQPQVIPEPGGIPFGGRRVRGSLHKHIDGGNSESLRYPVRWPRDSELLPITLVAGGGTLAASRDPRPPSPRSLSALPRSAHVGRKAGSTVPLVALPPARGSEAPCLSRLASGSEAPWVPLPAVAPPVLFFAAGRPFASWSSGSVAGPRTSERASWEGPEPDPPLGRPFP